MLGGAWPLLESLWTDGVMRLAVSGLFSQFIKPFGIRLTSYECADLI